MKKIIMILAMVMLLSSCQVEKIYQKYDQNYVVEQGWNLSEDIKRTGGRFKAIKEFKAHQNEIAKSDSVNCFGDFTMVLCMGRFSDGRWKLMGPMPKFIIEMAKAYETDLGEKIDYDSYRCEPPNKIVLCKESNGRHIDVGSIYNFKCGKHRVVEVFGNRICEYDYLMFVPNSNENPKKVFLFNWCKCGYGGAKVDFAYQKNNIVMDYSKIDFDNIIYEKHDWGFCKGMFPIYNN